MAVHTLFRRWRTGILGVVSAESPARAIEAISDARGSLAYADLRGIDAPRCFLPAADLRGADIDAAVLSGSFLERADLRSASLVATDLRRSTLRRADFRRADLRGVDLRGADLRGADFEGTDLRDALVAGARLDDARLDWQSSAFALELLRRDNGPPPGASRLLAEIAFAPDERPYSWLAIVARNPDLIGWAMSVIGRAIRPDDGAPEILKRLTSDAIATTHAESLTSAESPTAGFYWTRAVHPRGSPRRHAR